MIRVRGPIENMWDEAPDRAAAERAIRGTANPIIERETHDPTMALWTWVVDAPDATHVLLWMNPGFPHADVERAELTRLPGSSLWTICLRLPAALRVGYRIAVWSGDGPPPWRAVQGRRPVIQAAMRTSVRDPRCGEVIHGSLRTPTSIGAGPDAPLQPWRWTHEDRRSLAELRFDDDRTWVYAPRGVNDSTPLLVLFDGQDWIDCGITAIFDELIDSGVLAPLHCVLIDSGARDRRFERLGVPGGQVDLVFDQLLPTVRRHWPVLADPANTVVAGQSLGGMSALWALARPGGGIGHAIAQSPSLWRRDITDDLLAAAPWASLEVQVGSFELDMLDAARALTARLHGDRTSGAVVTLTEVDAGHDWAAWRVNLIAALTRLFPGPRSVHAGSTAVAHGG